jgi:hypothetical protein
MSATTTTSTTTTRTSTAFGLDVESELPLSLLAGSTARPTGRPLGVAVGTAPSTGSRWPEDARLICDERQPDGAPIYRIESHPEAGYLMAGPRYGAHRLSADGRLLWCDPEGLDDAEWQRLLIAQVLPFAALLRGLEILHASAVLWRGQAVAFLGRSRAGKTSLALELCARGKGFLADDVLALECGERRLMAHPGTPVAGVARAPAASGREAEDCPEGCPHGEVGAVNARERLVRLSGASEPAPLAALFFLDRRADGPDIPRFEPAADARMLLSATFNFVLATPERLRGLLEVCALAARLRVERVACGPGTGVSQLAAAIEQRLDAAP